MAKRIPLVFEGGEIIESKSTDTMDLNNGVVKAKGATTERSLADKLADALSVKDFGAKGDGTTDDTAAFEAAAEHGGVIYVPHGTYKLIRAVQGDFISFGHPTFTGAGASAMDTNCTDLYNDYVHKNDEYLPAGTYEHIYGDKQTHGKWNFKGQTVFDGAETHNGAEIHNGAETHKGAETHEGNETHGKSSGTTLTYHGTEIHDGPETHGGTEIHNGSGTYNAHQTFNSGATIKGSATISGGLTVNGEEHHHGATTYHSSVTFSGPININSSIVSTLVEDIIATPENNGFYPLTSTGGKLKVDASEFISDGLSVVTENNIKKIKVDFQKMTPEQLLELLDVVVDKEGGLNFHQVGDDVLLYVDFSAMDDSKFTDLLDSLNLPYYVDGTKIKTHFYVNPAVTGNVASIDTTKYPDVVFPSAYVNPNTNMYSAPKAADEESYFVEKTTNGKTKLEKRQYGRDENHPWLSIQYAADVLARRYNINTKTIRVHVNCKDGNNDIEYIDTITLAQQSRSTGRVLFQPSDANDTIIVHRTTNKGDNCVTHTGGSWGFVDTNFILTLGSQNNGSPKFPCIISTTSQAGGVSLYNCTYEFEDFSEVRSSNKGSYTLRALNVNGGSLNLYDTSYHPDESKLLANDVEPRFCYLNAGSVIKAGSWLNGRYISTDITLANRHYIKRYTKLVAASVIKGSVDANDNPTGSLILADSAINGTTLATNTVYASDVTIGENKFAELVIVPYTKPNSGQKFNYRSTFKGSRRSCRLSKNSVLKAGSTLNGVTYAEDYTLTVNTAAYNFTLATGSTVKADSFFIEGAKLNNIVQHGTHIVSDTTVSATTSYTEGSNAVSCDWFYIENGGIVELNNSGTDDDGNNYSNAVYYVEGRFDNFIKILYNGILRPRGTGVAPIFMYDPDKVCGKRYEVGTGGSLSVSATDETDRRSYLPGDIEGTVTSKTGAWVSPADDD